ncbi:NADH-quinone oxidoreductase subunit L [Cryptosporangium aurantiacum]|uniref:NADH dehydrogenase subunit L n=1 Tax=Cryptosporangium aurantiacum TaxID=134849 RepID=A0A1M7RMK8_9ACTN|nr:NADH-quinone oxidoreductase subunit L [Cryptosporangium aurantiacum]SHN47410.1 NADH dehydrogenase subunit L [Cryptosporangium aurantiacum]
MNTNVALAAALPALPGAAGLAGLLLRPANRRWAAALGVTTVAAALVAAVALWLRLATDNTMPRRYADYLPSGFAQEVDAATRLADFGPLNVLLAVRVDTEAAVVAVMVCLVALAVQVYSIAYLRDDDRYGPYAAQVSLFTAAMLLVVVSGDLFLLLIGWEVMGLCSYLLIGHDRSLPEAPGAAVKAFLVTRVGDVGFLLGVVVLGVDAGSFRIADILAADLSDGTLLAACLLLLAGVAGKSAQFPLHTWLPDAMAGPTPISALIHAATMVAAGVYVVFRLFPLYTRAPDALAVLGVVAAVTMLLAACAALAQDDLKRVLAWSTVSQLAYMTGALAVGNDGAALQHLLTHAGFKALLFLAAGAVIHAVASNLMSGMGGLRRTMPVTFWTTTIGLAALAGLPPFSGFWTKEYVLGAAEEAAAGHAVVASWVGWVVLIAGLVTTALTGAYAARLWLRTFFGSYRGTATPHDPPALMRWPVVLLAVPAAFGGAVVLWSVDSGVGWFAYAPSDGHAEVEPVSSFELHPSLALAATALALLGAGVMWWRWRRDPVLDGPRIFADAFGIDAVQRALVVRPVRTLARFARVGDARAVGGTATGTGRGAIRLGRTLAGAHARGLGGYVTTALAGGALLAVLAAIGVLR